MNNEKLKKLEERLGNIGWLVDMFGNCLAEEARPDPAYQSLHRLLLRYWSDATDSFEAVCHKQGRARKGVA